MLEKLKILLNESIIYGLFFILGRFLTFLLTPLYTNYLSVVEFADITNIFSYIAFLNIFYAIGFDSAYFRFYDKDDKQKSRDVFSTSYIAIFIVTFSLTIFFSFFYEPIANFICDSPNRNTLVFYALLIPFFDVISYVPFLYLRITNQAKVFTIIRLVNIFITIVLTYIFIIQHHLGALGVVYSHLIASFLSFATTFYILFKNFQFNFDFVLFKEMLKYSIPTIPAQLSGVMLNLGDKPIVKALTNSESVSVYNANYRLGLPMMLLVLAFDYAWKPFYLTHYKDKEANKLFARVLTYITILASAIFLIVSFYIQEIVSLPFLGGKLINPIYWSGLFIVPIILAGYYFNGMYNIFAAGINISKETKYLSYSIIIAASYNLIGNLVLVKYFGYPAAAWNTLISYLISAIAVYYFSQKVYPITYEWRRILLLIFATFFVFAVYELSQTYFSEIFASSTYKHLLRFFLFCLFLYLLFSLKFLNKEELRVIKRILKRK